MSIEARFTVNESSGCCKDLYSVWSLMRKWNMSQWTFPCMNVMSLILCKGTSVQYLEHPIVVVTAFTG